MIQRIFDTDNEEDMKDLWNILPDEVDKIEKYPDGVLDPFAGFCAPSLPVGMCRSLIKINWHDKIEITRPVNYKDMIGCIGWFHDGEEVDKEHDTMGILSYYDSTHVHPFVDKICGFNWQYFTPAKKSELKFYGD